MRPGFSHAFVFRYDAVSGQWINCEWCAARLHIEVLPPEIVNATLQYMKESGFAVLAFTVENNGPVFLPRMPVYCISWIKQLLGVRRCWALTPWQLFCALKKRGAEVIFDFDGARHGH